MATAIAVESTPAMATRASHARRARSAAFLPVPTRPCAMTRSSRRRRGGGRPGPRTMPAARSSSRESVLQQDWRTRGATRTGPTARPAARARGDRSRHGSGEPHRPTDRLVGEIPVEIALPGEDRAGVAAPIVMTTSAIPRRERLGVLLGKIDPDLFHRGNDSGVDLVGWRGPRGSHDHPPSGMVVEQPGCHLRPSRVVGADEQHARFSHGSPSEWPGRGPESPPGAARSRSLRIRRSPLPLRL